MATIGLCMIVKDEAPRIERCLDSTLGLVDYYCISDTGSCDETKEIITRWLDRHHLVGEIEDQPWQDFAYNRTVVLKQLSRHPDIDYALMLDADDILVYERGFVGWMFKRNLVADVYHVMIRHGTLKHARAQICRNDGRFYYRGVVHEFLVGPEGTTGAAAQGLFIVAGTTGARSSDPEKYRKDALLLEEALADNPDEYLRRRYTFYLGNSWRDAGEPSRALTAYEARAQLGGWADEVALSILRAGQAMIALGWGNSEVIGQFLAAYEACPWRAEALHAAARYCRETGKFHQGYLIARHGTTIKEPADGLFLEPWIYRYGMLDELSVAAYWTGRYGECLTACEQLLADGIHPDRERIARNLGFAREKLSVGS